MANRRTNARLNLLTVKQIQTAGEGDHNDGGGLLLRVRGQSAAWVLRFTSPAGRRREMGLGPAYRDNAAVTGNSVTRARDSAHEARKLIQSGVDPIDARDARRLEEQARATEAKAAKRAEHLTLIRAARDYHERVIEPNRSTKHAAQWIASIEGPKDEEARAERAKLAALLSRPIATITAPELLDAMVDLMAAVPETARRVRQRLEAIFDDAEFRGLCAGNPARSIRRKLRESNRRRERGHFAALDYAQVPIFMAELRRQPGTAARALEFALLTAARTGEVLGAVWAEFDEAAGVWRIPGARMKGGEEHVVFLSADALAILAAMRQSGSDHVFPSPTKPRQPLSNMAMLTVLRRMGRHTETTVHGLCRAAFSTWAHETAAARPDVIEACLAHQEQDRVRASYNRARFNAERQALLKGWADYLLGREPASNVTPLRPPLAVAA